MVLADVMVVGWSLIFHEGTQWAPGQSRVVLLVVRVSCTVTVLFVMANTLYLLLGELEGGPDTHAPERLIVDFVTELGFVTRHVLVRIAGSHIRRLPRRENQELDSRRAVRRIVGGNTILHGRPRSTSFNPEFHFTGGFPSGS